MGVLDIVKKHPIASVVGGLVIFLLFYMMAGGGGGGGSNGGPSDAVRQAEIAANVQNTQANDALAAANAQVAAQLAAAKLQAQATEQQNSLAAKVAMYQTAEQAKTTDLANTLAAHVQMQQISAQDYQAKLNYYAGLSQNATQVQLAGIQANTALQIQQSNNQTQLGLMQLMAYTALGQSYYQQKAAGGKRGFCFITTVVCEAMGKADNCEELQTLRSFRDDWLLPRGWGQSLYENYKLVGPMIVAYIEAREDKVKYCEALHEAYIRPAVIFVLRGHMDAALEMYLDLINQCLTDVHSRPAAV